MDIQVVQHGQTNVLILKGKMDLGNTGQIKDTVKTLLEKNKTAVHLNMKGVDFINSSGLGALISIMKEVRMHRGRLTLSDLAPYVREIFEITQLTHVFEIFNTTDEVIGGPTLAATHR
jgi:anti-sigma B factor antagonist